MVVNPFPFRQIKGPETFSGTGVDEVCQDDGIELDRLVGKTCGQVPATVLLDLLSWQKGLRIRKGTRLCTPSQAKSARAVNRDMSYKM